MQRIVFHGSWHHLKKERVGVHMPGPTSYAEWSISGLLLCAYLLGSIPWGLILARIFAQQDIRQTGSGNIGATNVAREAGIMPGLLTLIGDFLKGVLPVYLTRVALGTAGGSGAIFLSAVALAAFLGHLFPVYLKFRDGGKGVATAAGCFAMISSPAVLSAGIVFMVLLFAARRVSVASLSAAIVLPIAIWISSRSGTLTTAASIITFLIFIRHWENLKRLVAGTEPEFKISRSMRK